MVYYAPHYIYEGELREELTAQYGDYNLEQALEFVQKDKIRWIEDLGYNPRAEQDSFWQQFPNLEYVGLADRYHSIPNGIFQLKKLKILDMSSNWITEVPDLIENLKELVYLNLENNDILYLSPKVYNLPKLRFLMLGDSEHLQLEPRKILSMPHLEALSISCRSLTQAEQALIRAHKPHIWMG